MPNPLDAGSVGRYPNPDFLPARMDLIVRQGIPVHPQSLGRMQDTPGGCAFPGNS